MPTCTERDTKITLKPMTHKATPGSNVVFHAEVQNKDSRGCDPTTFAMRCTLTCATGLDGKTTPKLAGSIELKPAQKAKQDWSVYVGPNQKPGDVIEVEMLTFRGTERTPSGSARATVTVE